MTRLAFRLRIPLHHLLMGALLLMTVLPAAVLSGHSQAASMTWDGGGTTNNWSDCANWSGDVCPGASDTVTFNSTSTKDSVVDTSFAGTITTLNLASGWTGTLSLSRSLTVSGTLTQNFGNFNAGPQALTLGGLVLGGGSFTASSGTTSDSGVLTITGGTFNANGGTMNFNGNVAGALACNNVTFNLVTFTNTGGNRSIPSGCNLPLGNNPNANSGASISLNGGTLSGTGTFNMVGGGATLNLNSGSLSGFSGLTAANLAVTGAFNFSSYTTFTAANFTLNAGANFTAPSGTMSVSSGFAINSGVTFNAGSGTVNFSGSVNSTISCNNATFNLVTFNLTAGNKTVSSDCNLPLGNSPAIGSNGSTLTLNGTLSGSGTMTTTGGTLALGSGGALSGFTGLAAAGALTVNGTYDFTNYSPFTVGGTFTLNSGGTFTAPSGIAEFDSTFTINDGSTFNAGSGTVNFGGSGGTLACSSAVFNLVTLTNTGTKTINGGCNLPLGDNPQATNGGGINLKGTLSGSGVLTTDYGVAATLNIQPSGSLSGFSGLHARSLTVTGTHDFTGYSPFYILSNLTIPNGTLFSAPLGTDVGNLDLNAGSAFTAPADTMNVRAALTIDPSATFNANGGIMNFTQGGAGASASLACGNAVFNLVTFTQTSGTKIVGSDCSLPLGNNPSPNSGGNITLNGTLSGSGTLTTQGSIANTLRINSSGVLSGFSGLNVNAITLASGGALNMANYSSFVAHDAVAVGSSATFTLPTAGATIYGDVSLIAGSNFVAPSGSLYLGGDFEADSSDAFDANNGTVVLNGIDQVLNGDITFSNLTKTATSDDMLTFVADSTTTVAGTLTLHGSSGAYLSLVSDTPGSPWYLDAGGATNVYSVDVADSHVLGDSVTACTSIDDGGNAGWIFNPSSCNPDHGGSGANTAISNYVALQAYLTNQQAQQNQAQNTQHQQIAMNGGLPDKIQQFIQEFPNSKAITAGLTDFLKAATAGVSIGFLIGLGWWLWIILARRRKQTEEYQDPPQTARIVTPTISAPTIQPSKDKGSRQDSDQGGTA